MGRAGGGAAPGAFREPFHVPRNGTARRTAPRDGPDIRHSAPVSISRGGGEYSEKVWVLDDEKKG